MDVKEKIKEIVEEIMENPSLKEQFETEPVKAIESLLDVDLPDDVVQMVVDGVKANLTVESISKVTDALKKLF